MSDDMLDNDSLDIVVDNIFTICNVKVRSPVMTSELKKYLSGFADSVLGGKF